MTDRAKLAKQHLTEFKSKVEVVIERIYQGELKIAKEFTPEAVRYIEELRNVTLAGGKRLRASFVYYTYMMYRGEKMDAILEIAAALEIVHAFFLVEDDFMDLADTRRGYQTIHKTYEKYHKDSGFKKDAGHFGNAVAVNVGIIGDHLAFNVVTNSDFPDALKLKALDRLNRQVITTGHGQIHDILNEVKRDLTEQDILNVLLWKTGIYTYDNPIHVGAILAGADDEQLKKLSEYAIPAGIAFQIQDDILGSFGDQAKMGKPADGDIKEGKQTLLTYKAYSEGTHAQKQLLDEVLGKHDASDEEIDKIREIFVETGALDYSKQRSLELVREARATLEANDEGQWNSEGVDYLAGIADYMIDRDL